MKIKDLKEILSNFPDDMEIKVFDKGGEDLDEVGVFAEEINEPYLFVGNNLHLLSEQSDLERYSYYSKMDVEAFMALLSELYKGKFAVEDWGDDFILTPLTAIEEPLFIYTDGDVCDFDEVTKFFGREVTLTLVEENKERYILITA